MKDLYKQLGKLIYEKRILELSEGNNDAMIERIDAIIKKIQEEIKNKIDNESNIIE